MREEVVVGERWKGVVLDGMGRNEMNRDRGRMDGVGGDWIRGDRAG